jgi:hypothetical protein
MRAESARNRAISTRACFFLRILCCTRYDEPRSCRTQTYWHFGVTLSHFTEALERERITGDPASMAAVDDCAWEQMMGRQIPPIFARV